MATLTQMVTSGFAVAKALGLGDSTYQINRMYIEFENVATPATAVSVPTFSATAGLAYYQGLVSPKDYLSVPLLGQSTLSIATGYESYFTAGVDGNQLTFLAQSAGSAGVNGVPFSNALNSKVYGIALVSAPDSSDATKDILIARGYYAVADQMIAPASGQVHVNAQIVFAP